MTEPEEEKRFSMLLLAFDIAALLLGVLVLAGLFWYVNANRSNHTGFDYKYKIPAGYIAIAAYVGLHVALSKKVTVLQILVLLVCATGIVTVWVLNHYSIMLYYEDWCERGMPLPYQRLGERWW
jgi:hypothetical protein